MRTPVDNTCMITVGNTRNIKADSLTGTQLMPSSASRSPTGQWQLPLDRGLRRHKWEHPVSRQGLEDLGCRTSCIIWKKTATCQYTLLKPWKSQVNKSSFLIIIEGCHSSLYFGQFTYVAFSGRMRGILWRVHYRPWVHKAVQYAWWGQPCSCLSSSSYAVLFLSLFQTRRLHPPIQRLKRGSWSVLTATSKMGEVRFLGWVLHKAHDILYKSNTKTTLTLIPVPSRLAEPIQWNLSSDQNIFQLNWSRTMLVGQPRPLLMSTFLLLPSIPACSMWGSPPISDQYINLCE